MLSFCFRSMRISECCWYFFIIVKRACALNGRGQTVDDILQWRSTKGNAFLRLFFFIFPSLVHSQIHISLIRSCSISVYLYLYSFYLFLQHSPGTHDRPSNLPHLEYVCRIQVVDIVDVYSVFVCIWIYDKCVLYMCVRRREELRIPGAHIWGCGYGNGGREVFQGLLNVSLTGLRRLSDFFFFYVFQGWEFCCGCLGFFSFYF